MDTLRIRFTPEFGGHEGLLNACDFDPARHIRLDSDEPKPKKGAEKTEDKPAKPKKGAEKTEDKPAKPKKGAEKTE
jgi:hypothetical protein